MNRFSSAPYHSMVAFFIILLSGCVYTEVAREGLSIVKAPSHKMLVCSLSPVTEHAVRFETLMIERLAKHKVETSICTQWMTLHSSLSDEERIFKLKEEGFDSILVIQREALPLTKNADPKAARPQPFYTVEEFMNAYDHRHEVEERRADSSAEKVERLPIFPKQRSISGHVKLIGIPEDEVLWSVTGAVLGSSSKPLKDFVEAAVVQIEKQLTVAGLIPPS